MGTKDIEAVYVGDRAGIHYRVAVGSHDDPHIQLERRCGEHVMSEDHYAPEYAQALAFTLLEAALFAASSALD